MIKKTLKWNNLPYLVILLMSVLLISFFRFSYINGDDSVFHLANIEVIKNNLFHLSKIRPIIANNYGYGIGIFYPQLPHIIGGIFSFFTSFIGSKYLGIKLTKLLMIFLSGLFMYFYVNKIYKSKIKALFASISYITSSYFIVDIFYRDALNESFVFVFMPLVFLGIYYLLYEDNTYKFLLLFVLGYVGLMLSHLVLAVWFSIYVIIYLIFYYKKVFKKRNILAFISASIIILLLSSPFTIPMIEHMKNGTYYVFFRIYNANSVWRMSFKDYLYRNIIKTYENYLFINLSLCTLITSILSFIKLFKKDNKLKYQMLTFLILGCFGMLCTSSLTIWKIVPSMLRNIQFAWRSATFVTFFITVFSVDGLDYLYKGFKKKYIPTLIIIILLGGHLFISLDKVVLKEVDSCISTCGMGWQQEYLPVETIESDYINTRENDIILLNGTADIEIIKNNVPNLEFKVTNIDKEIEIEVPRIYYLGYQIKDSKNNIINYSKDKNGFMSIKLKKNGNYKITYKGTLAYKISLIITVITFPIYMFILIKLKRKNTI